MDWRELSSVEREVLNSIVNGSFEVSPHGLERMSLRGVQHKDIIAAAKTAVAIKKQRNKRFKIVGFDRFNLKLTLIVEWIEGMTIVTVY